MTDRIRNEMSGVARSVLQAGVMHVHQAPARPDPAVVARPIGDWNPFDLDVHRAISTPADAQLPELPGYLRRDHDDELARLVSDPQRSVFVVLTGGSSTGKTRALYEAVVAQLSDWPLRYPRTSDTLLGLIEHDRIKPRTVLWLNETQNHLSGPSGDAVAAWLRTVLDGSVPGPIVVLGTLWPQYWADLTTVENPHTRALLQHSVKRVRVAEQFTVEQLSQVRTGADIDPRLAAAAIAKDGHVIQTLAGGPALVERYEHPDRPADRYAAAIISAAIDARRLGFRSLLPLALLADAAPGYLSDEDRTDPPPDWFAQGLAQAAKDPVYGITALTARRLQRGAGPPDGYDLHDYLDQHGQIMRVRVPAPESLWEALAAHATDTEDLIRLMFSAYHRLLHRHGDELLSRFTAPASVPEMWRIAGLLIDFGRVREALALGPAVLVHLAVSVVEALLLEGRADDALQQYINIHTVGGSQLVESEVVDTFLMHGAVEQAIKLLRRLTEQESAPSLPSEFMDLRAWPSAERLAEVLARHHRVDELRERVEAGDPYAAEKLADELANTGQWAEALQVVRRGAAWWSIGWLARRFAETGQTGRLRELADLGDPQAAEHLMVALLAEGEVAEALELYDARVADDPKFLPSEPLMDSLVAHGEADRVIATITVESITTTRMYLAQQRFGCLIRSMRSHGQTDQVLTLLRRLTNPDDLGQHDLHSDALVQLVDLLADQGDWAEVLSILRQGHYETRSWFAGKLRDLGKVDELRKLADTGNSEAQQYVVDALLETGKAAEALDLLRQFADAHSTTVRHDDGGAARRLAWALGEQKRFAELRTRTAQGDKQSAEQLVYLARRGELPQAEQLLKYGLTVDGAISEG